MVHCPWCELYVKWYLRDDGTLSNEEKERDRKRIHDGFWASITQVNDEQFLANKALSVEEALKRRLPVQIDLASGSSHFGRFWCFEMAEQRDQVLDDQLEHFWFLSGGCSMSWMTPICCELANATDFMEQIQWEKGNFPEMRDLTSKLEILLKKTS